MQRKVDRRGKRNVVFRSILAGRDNDEIAAWNQDLVRILHVFNVRSTGFIGNAADSIAPFQTELAIDTNIRVAVTQTMVADTRMTVANSQTMIANTQAAIADAQTTVANTQTMVADIHRNMLAGQKGDSSQNNSVGMIDIHK
jgi:hypothetical protein